MAIEEVDRGVGNGAPDRDWRAGFDAGEFVRDRIVDRLVVTGLEMQKRNVLGERLHERGRRAAMFECYAAGNVFQVRPTLSESSQQPGNRRFAFAGQHAIHSAAGVPQNFFWDKRNTVSTNTDECLRR